jgi:rhodanese-related sulfurtransferase
MRHIITDKTGISRLRLYAAVLICLFPVYPAAVANAAPDLSTPKVIVPEKIAGVTTVSAEQLIEQLTSEHPPILIDSRIRQDRDYGYIESSISLPDIETNCETLKQVAEDKNSHLLFYCNGIQCGRSVVAIKIARSCGYHHLSWFKGGFAEWKQKGYQYVRKD